MHLNHYAEALNHLSKFNALDYIWEEIDIIIKWSEIFILIYLIENQDLHLEDWEESVL